MADGQLGTVLRHIRQLAVAQSTRELSDGPLLERFTASKDQAAFAALVQRYGRLVWSVCRHVLGHDQDAEDSFQATFLVLAQRAASIRRSEAVSSWLHGVAYRVAMKAKRDAARRRARERAAQPVSPGQPFSETGLRELQAVLDDEVHRLPEKLRAPFVLCCLEGKSTAEAAQLLRWKVGTVSGRLSLARKELQRRLTRRGLMLSAALCVLGISRTAEASSVPAGLTSATVRGALAHCGGHAAAEVSAEVAALAQGVVKTMMLSSLKNLTAGLIILTAGLAGAGLVIHQALAEKPAQENTEGKPPEQRAQQAPAKTTTPKPAAPARADEQDATKTVTFAGRVLDPDGKPVKNAKLFINTFGNIKPRPLTVRAVSDDSGQYRFTVPKAEFDTTHSPEPWKYSLVLAMADGYGLGLPQKDFEKWSEPLPIDDLTIHVAKDDVPINGRVVDLQAKPMVGVKVRVRGIQWPYKGDLTSFIAALKTKKEGFSVQQEFLVGIRDPYRGFDLDNLYPPVVTDADGRFRINGVGRERLADLLITGPTIETKLVYAMTRQSETIDVPYYRQSTGGPPGVFVPIMPIPQYTHYGANFEHVAAPSKPVGGVVRDKETGKPIPGAVIRSYRLANNVFDERVNFRVVADKDGRYRITGLPYGEGNQIQAGGAPDGKPYVMAIKEVGTSPGLEPITTDIELKRGVWITGKVTDKVTGKPVRCQFDYLAFEDNPHLKDLPNFTTGSQDERITEDGTFRIVGLPGHGVIAVKVFDDNYLLGVGADRIKGEKDVSEHLYFKAKPYFFYPTNYNAVAEINPDKDAKEVTCNLVLDPGKTLSGTILAPDGKPLAGAFVRGLSATPEWNYPALATAEFKMIALKLGQRRRLSVVHKDQRLAGTLLLRGDEKGPLTIKLEPWGVATGKLVVPEGKDPSDYQIITLSGVVMTVEGVQPPDFGEGDLLQPVKPDKDGKFRIEGLVPGLKYRLQIGRGNYVASPFGRKTEVTVKSGETKDIGELKVKSIDEN